MRTCLWTLRNLCEMRQLSIDRNGTQNQCYGQESLCFLLSEALLLSIFTKLGALFVDTDTPSRNQVAYLWAVRHLHKGLQHETRATMLDRLPKHPPTPAHMPPKQPENPLSASCECQCRPPTLSAPSTPPRHLGH